MAWAALLPDLNPLDYSWGELTVQVYLLKTGNKNHQRQDITDTWVFRNMLMHYVHCNFAQWHIEHIINVMSTNHRLCIVSYVSRLYGHPISGAYISPAGLLSYKNMVECGRNCFDFANSTEWFAFFNGTSLFPNFSVVTWERACGVCSKREHRGSDILNCLPVSLLPLVCLLWSLFK